MCGGGNAVESGRTRMWSVEDLSTGRGMGRLNWLSSEIGNVSVQIPGFLELRKMIFKPIGKNKCERIVKCEEKQKYERRIHLPGIKR